MKKFFSLTFLPFFLSLSSFSLNSCKADTFNFSLKDLTDTAVVKDYRLKYSDGSNFYFDKNKKSRYFVMTREALCYPEFSGVSLWKYGVKVQVYVPDDEIWDKVASIYNFDRSTNKKVVKNKMSEGVLYIKLTCVLNVDMHASKCVLTNIEKLPAWEPE